MKRKHILRQVFNKKKNLLWRKFGAGVLIIIIIMLVAIIQPTSAEESAEDEIILNFSFTEPIITEVNVSNTTFHTVTMNDTKTFNLQNLPVLPVKPLKVLLPQKAILESIDISLDGSISIGDGYNVLLGDESSPGQNQTNMTYFNPAFPYPSEIISNTEIFEFKGYSILVFNLFPVHYISQNGSLYYYEDMTVTIKTNTTGGSVSPYFRDKMEDESLMKQFVDDYTMNHTYTDIPSPPGNSSIVNSSEDYDFVIITRKAYAIKPFLPPSIRCWRTFWDLAEFKNNTGIKTKIVTIKDILKEPKYHYGGDYGDNDSFFNDTQCHIRNFIRHAVSAWGINYVLLGGDNSSIIGNEIVPARNLWFKYQVFPNMYDSTLPSDFYYACLDGDFNYDKNEYWGEPWDGGPGGDLSEPAVHEGEKYAEINSEDCDTSFATGLFTPSLNLSDSNNTSLKFYTVYKAGSDDRFSNVSIYSGGTNTSNSNFEGTIWSNGGIGEINIPIDTSNYSDPSCVYIQFNYTELEDISDYGTFNIDNVSVSKNASIILWEKFEGNEFPPEGWTIVQYEGDGTWIQEYYRIDVDLCPEVFIGRAPVGNIKEVSNFVRKTLKYEQTPNYDPVIAKALLVGGKLDAKTYAGDSKDEIINFSNANDYFTYGIPEDNYTIDTLYDRDELYRVENDTFHYWPRENFTEKINDGVHLMNKDGHGYNDMIIRHFYGDEDKLKEDRDKWGIDVDIRFYNLHTYLLKNKIPFFMYAQSCLVGAFDNYYYDWRNFTIPILNKDINISPGVHHSGLFDCLGEYLTVKSIHGAFAVIMNAREGFYEPGGTDSISQKLDRYFFNATFGDFINTGDPNDIHTLGKAHHEAKMEILNELVNDDSTSQTQRLVSYGLNLLGDPTVSFKVPEEGNSPNKPATPKIESKLGNFYEFSTNTSHPNGDRVSYKFKWDDHECFLWTKFYDSGETATKIIILPSGFHNISVKARDIYGLESEWSDLLPMSVSFDSDISIDSSLTVLGEETQFYGQTAEPYTTWYYDLGDGNNSEQQNTTHTYNTLGTYNVTLTVTDDQNISSNVTRVVNVVLLKVGFDSSDCGIPNETIYFNDTSDAYHTIINWSWDFGEGNIAYDQNTSHQYAIEGAYNVSLTVTDNESNTNVSYQTIYIDSGIPEITSVSNNFDVVGYGSDITFTANLTDSISGVKTVKVNVTYPDNAYGNFTMNNINGRYEYVFNDTGQLGDYSYIIWAIDNADNSICSPEYDFIVYRCFGYNMIGGSNQTIWNTITGSRFTVYEKSVADNITVYLDPGNASSDFHYQCMIYRHNDSKLMGISEEKNISGGKGWQTFNFSVPKPVLMDDIEYVLGCWADNYTIHIYYDDGVGEEMFYDDGTSTLQGHYFEGVYNYAPDINNFDHEDRKYSIYCKYTSDNTSPDVTNVSGTPGTVGFGFNITIAADVTDNVSGVEAVKVNITYPDDTTGNFSMDNENNTYDYVFSDTWLVGQYSYTIWVIDYAGNSNSSTGYSFSVSAEATISVCTIKDDYGDNETINLTDPPGDPPLIGYELLDGGKVLHIWNKYDSYYFNTSSGIQITNHYEEYWSHNVLMLGYYNNDEWNLIYRADELSGFNKNIEFDNENYVNATLWKDLTYSGYSFRLAVRYHLGIDDNELTVIPYIKNLGQAIPYVLGFAWEINDIQVDMTPENDYIKINGTSFYLNETIDVRFTNMTAPVYCWNETMNESYVCGYEPIPYFYIKENLSGNRYESLYLRWDDSLEYMVQVESRDGEYNAPVTLAFKVGTLDVDQEKHTELRWHDASEVIYYFNSYNEEKAWACHPEWMVDGNICTTAGTETQGSVELLDGNDCPGTDIGAISKVEIRASGFYDWGAYDNDIILTPLFEGYKDGNKHIFDCGFMPDHWSRWFDITTDENAPEIWTWNDISNLDCLVEADSEEIFRLYCSKVEIRVIFIENTAEEVYFFIDEFESDWEYPECMVDGDYGSFAYIIGKDEFGQYCSLNTCEEEDLGAISKVELRAYGYREEEPANISLTPVFGGENPGIEYIYLLPPKEQAWSEWFDITDDAHAPETWSWSDVKYLDCRVRALGGEFVLFCSKIEIQVKYTPPNNAPWISNPYPVGSSRISISPTLGITVSDPDGDAMDITWYRNSSGSWVAFGSNSTVGSGTYHQIFADASVNGQWWYWKVKVTDGNDYTESSVYKFYTGYQSKIKNTGSTDIRGYLLMQVHFFDEMLKEWVVADDTVNETNPRTINAGQQLGLDTIFNGLVNTNDLSEYGSGTYRIYAAFRDPYGNVLKCDNEDAMEGIFEFKIVHPLRGWFKLFADDGFGKASNLFTRGITIYKDEMYIGTENHNLSKLNLKDLLCNGFLAGTSITMANGSYKNIEDVEVGDIVKACDIGNGSYVNANVTMVFNYTSEWLPDNILKFNNQLCVSPNHLLYVNGTLMKAEEAQVDDYFTDVNRSNVTIISTANISESPSLLYNFLIAMNGSEEPLLPSNLTYFAEDVQVYPWGSSNISDYCYDWSFPIITFFKLAPGHCFTYLLTQLVCEISDGCELWKYNYTNNEWTELIGNTTGDSDLYSGFGDHRNCGVGDMVEFNGKLYVGTGHNKGCEIWRYDGSSWEQVVGENDTASIGRGFNDPFNSIAATMKVFENSTGVTHLYVGTINFNWGPNGFCQIWRTADGENWYKVVDRGFRDNGAESDVKNAYLWSMEVFQDKLYAGTFNIPYPDIMPWHHRGCQLWRTDTGNACEWEKVILPGGNYDNGFGEDKNYGIRKLVKWGNNLYVGVAASAVQVLTKKALEIWEYDGTNWDCIVGDESSHSGTEWKDGFGDYYNKYPWSMVVANDILWIGTLNHHFKLTKHDSEGCEVWCYNGTGLIASVEDVNGEEDNGFGQWFNRGARSMIEYPVGSGNIVVGTMTVNNPLDKEVEEEGCEIWMWHS